jgi:hypothetical protein
MSPREDEFINRVADFVRNCCVDDKDENAKRHNAAVQVVVASILDPDFNRPLVQAAWDFAVANGGSNEPAA